VGDQMLKFLRKALRRIMLHGSNKRYFFIITFWLWLVS